MTAERKTKIVKKITKEKFPSIVDKSEKMWYLSCKTSRNHQNLLIISQIAREQERRGDDMELSQRAKQLSQLLLEQPAGCPLTLAELSEQMHLSKRTIQRALPEVRSWMEERNGRVQARAGSGISVEASEEIKRCLLLELQGGADNAQYLPQRAELLEILLDAQQVLSIEQLSERLRCSRDAVEKQLPWIRDWLARYQIRLHVQTGVGLYIEGAEKDWRIARIEHIAAFHADAVMT